MLVRIATLLSVLGLLVLLPVPSSAALGPALGTFVVDRFDDPPPSGGCTPAPNDCSLREAVIAANTALGPNTIDLPAGTYHLTIKETGEAAAQDGGLDLTDPVTIQGDSAATTIVDAKGAKSYVFNVPSGVASVTLTDLTARKGTKGGIISQAAQLTLTDVVVTKNHASDNAGLDIQGALTLMRVTISRNRASDQNGGGRIASQGSSLAADLIVSRNRAKSGAGGLSVSTTAGNLKLRHASFNKNRGQVGGVLVDGNVTVSNITVDGNRGKGPSGVGGYASGSNASTLTSATVTRNKGKQAGGIAGPTGPSALTLNSVLVASNKKLNCAGTIASGGNNLVSGGACPMSGDTSTNITANPQIEKLKNNGGFSLTRALKSSSPAIDNGSGCPTEDQRDFTRVPVPEGGPGVCDIGAYEFDGTPPVGPRQR